MLRRVIGSIALFVLCLSAQAAAQPPRFADAGQALYSQNHLTAASSDEQKRAVTIQLAEQLAFEFPNQGWGTKTAGAGRPISKDCVAKVDQVNGAAVVKGVCFDWIKGGGGIQNPPLVNDIAGQVFVPVSPVNHLAPTAPPAPPAPSPESVTAAQLATAISELHTTLWNEVDSQLGAVRNLGLQTASRVSSLELAAGNNSGGGTASSGSASSGNDIADLVAIAREQLATEKAMLELLQKTAGRFGVIVK
jgi:hypothetical protein